MKSVSLKSKVGRDGFLRVNIPTKIKEKYVDVVVIYDAQNDANGDEASHWPENYFSETYGCLSSNPIKRQPQGEYPDREQLL